MARLKPRQKKFVSEYAKSGNATQAAKAAGYSKKTAGAIAAENLQKPHITAAIEKAVKRVTERAELKAADVLVELRKIAFVDLSHAYREDGTIKLPHEMPDDIRAALQSFESDELIIRGGFKIGKRRKVKLHDKVKSLELIGKYFKMFTDMQEHKVDATITSASEAEVKAMREKIKSDC